MAIQLWRKIPGKTLLVILHVFASVALIFEGYNQGVLGSVSATPGFIAMADIGADGIITNSTKQGGLVAIYYFGAMFGCFLGGWVADTYGRKPGVWLGSVLCAMGGALMSASQNANMFIVARVIAGLGIGFINAIIPPWVSELSQAHNRGASFALVFVANFLGIVIAYWVDFGVRNTGLQFRWRFPLAFMTLPSIIILLTTALLPDSPRWLMANDRGDEAVEVLAKLRGDVARDDAVLVDELARLRAMVEASHHKRNNFLNLIIGRYSGRLHLGRRVWMGFILQQITCFTGILAIATYAGTVFSLAGFDAYKSAWLAGLVNTFGIFGTAAAALVIDRLGRIKSLQVSFITQAITLFLEAALIRHAQLAPEGSAARTTLGMASAAMVFVFLWCFTMFNIVPSWIYATEIWPQEIRAKGYAFTVFGWAVGCGANTFIIPILLDRLGWTTFLLFGCCNVVSMPLVWFLFPEVAGKPLEAVTLLFSADSVLVRDNVREYERMMDQAGGDVAVATRRLLDSVDRENGEPEKGQAMVHVEDIHV